MSAARFNDLEQQLAYLRWMRWQNERSIREKLVVGKSMKEKDTLLKMSIDHAGERAMWMTSVVRDELSRPLVLVDDDMKYIQDEDKKIRERYVHNTTRQELTLNRLKETMRQRAESGQYVDPKLQARRTKKIVKIEGRISQRKKEIVAQMPIVHAKWSGHDKEIRHQQRTNRHALG